MSAEDLRVAWDTFKTGTLWTSTGRCKGFAASNPGEAAKLDQYVADIVAAKNPSMPSLVTATGRGLAGIINAGFPHTTAPIPPPPATGAHFDFRGVFCRDTEFDACYAHLDDLGVNAMGIWTGGTYNNALKRMNQLAAPHVGWTTIGSFKASTYGGAFNTTDAYVATVIQSIAQHPRNSHRYYIVDDTGNNMLSFTDAQRQLNLDNIKRRVALIHQYDPVAIVNGSEYRPEQIAMWKGVLDELVVDAYPSPNVDLAPDVIPNQAAWCDAAGIPYLIALSAHDFMVDQPAYPTDSQFAKAYAQAKATRARGVLLYIWYDAEGTMHLKDNPPYPLTGWTTVKREMLAY